jgi:hypothetical protein
MPERTIEIDPIANEWLEARECPDSTISELLREYRKHVEE